MPEGLLQFDPTEAVGFAPLPAGDYLVKTGIASIKTKAGEPLGREVDGEHIGQLRVQLHCESPKWAADTKRQLGWFMDLKGPWSGSLEDLMVAAGMPSVRDARRKKTTITDEVKAQLKVNNEGHIPLLSDLVVGVHITQTPDSSDPDVIYNNIQRVFPASDYREASAAQDPAIEFPLSPEETSATEAAGSTLPPS